MQAAEVAVKIIPFDTLEISGRIVELNAIFGERLSVEILQRR